MIVRDQEAEDEDEYTEWGLEECSVVKEGWVSGLYHYLGYVVG